jgi:hypothetical protein
MFIVFVPRVWKKSRQLIKTKSGDPESPTLVPQRAQLFIRPHNETLSVVAVCVCNPDSSPVAIHS